ncbi:YSP2 Membrane-anchored lipid-binding protein YSP2 [Candida maltosa Xu316]|uniref:VASt domain-containing protein n=1 Tax=Candida maltosa (strain Xu316) TaxID=1245528 RepID=M3JTE4_CANMX|nr:hypothetical protein G210_4200 [Candida maltosa Xu316]
MKFKKISLKPDDKSSEHSNSTKDSPKSNHRKSLNLFNHHNQHRKNSSGDKSFEFRGMLNSINRSHSQSRVASTPGTQTPITLPSSPTMSRSNSLAKHSGNVLKVHDKDIGMPSSSIAISNEELDEIVSSSPLQPPRIDPAISIDVKDAGSASRTNSGTGFLSVPERQVTNTSQSANSEAHSPAKNSIAESSSSNNATQQPQPQAPPPPKSESNGFLSSLLSAAANKMSSTPPPPQQPTTDEKKKDHNTFASKLDNLLKGVKHEESRGSLIGENVDDDKNQLARTSTEMKSVHSLTQEVQFEPVRESPLNTLGNGDLSLADFDSRIGTAQTTGITSRRPSFRSADSNTKSALNPDTVNSSLPSGNQLQLIGNGSDVKRVQRKSAGFGGSDGRQSSSIGRNSFIDNQSSDDQNRNSIGAVKSRSTIDGEDLELYSDSELENLDNIVDYSKKIKHASKKRNKEFHQVFKKLPSNEKLIDDFSCAVSKDILVQGKMYLTDHFICFNSNILGWVTNLIIPLREVIQIEKKSTAVLFPNGMVIRTLHQKYVFATFLSRDSTFDLITNVWHRVLLENSDIDPKKLQATIERKRKRAISNASRDDDGDDDDDSLDESMDGDLGGSDEDNDDSGVESGNEASLDIDDNDSDEKGTEESEGASPSAGAVTGKDTFKGLPLVGPLTHAPTETGYNKDPSETFITEDTIKAPPGVVFLIIFGSDTSKYIKILKDQKNFDITESSIKGLSKDHKERSYTYIKPLGGAIGPKQTKCVIEDKLVEYQPDKYYEVEQTTQTPDVPSGNSFKVKTKIFLSWAANNETKIYIVTSIEWSGKSWIKGAIEKGTIDGQKESMKTMIATVSSIVAQGGAGGVGKKSSKRKSRSRKGTVSKKPEEVKVETQEPAKPKSINEQVLDLINSLGDLVPIPMISNTIVGCLVLIFGFLLTVTVFNKLTMGHRPQTIEIIPSNLYTSKIQINGEKYLVLPTIEANFNNERLRKQEELSIWNWMNDRSNGRLNLSYHCDSFEKLSNEELKTKYSEQELKEIVRLTKLKLDKLSEKLNDINL